MTGTYSMAITFLRFDPRFNWRAVVMSGSCMRFLRSHPHIRANAKPYCLVSREDRSGTVDLYYVEVIVLSWLGRSCPRSLRAVLGKTMTTTKPYKHAFIRFYGLGLFPPSGLGHALIGMKARHPRKGGPERTIINAQCRR
jgi:hypothetical protein